MLKNIKKETINHVNSDSWSGESANIIPFRNGELTKEDVEYAKRGQVIIYDNVSGIKSQNPKIKSTLDFLQTILPPQGPYALKHFENERDAIKAKRRLEPKGTQFFESLEAMDKRIEILDEQGYTVFFGAASYIKGVGKADGDNVRALQAYRVDLDIGPAESKYSSQVEALEDLKLVSKKMGLPIPLIIKSGGGLHAYWPLTKPVTPHEWVPVAQQLKEKFEKVGLKQDKAVTADKARIMRCPGTTHRKTDEDRDVKVIPSNYQITTPEYFADIVSSYDLTNALPPVGPEFPVFSNINIGRPETPENVELVKSLLAAVSADCDYDHYRQTIWSVISTNWRCAEQLALEWSKTAPDRFEEQTFAEIVNGFDPNRGTTLGTLYHYAREAGWSDISTIQLGGAYPNTSHTVPSPKHLTTDLANAKRLADAYGDSLISVANAFYRWNGRYWKKDESSAFGDACTLSKLITEEALIYKHRADNTENEDERDALMGIVTALKKWAKQSEMKNRIDAAFGMLRKLVAVESDQLDNNPWLLNVQNGTVDLRTATLKPHDKGDYITMYIPIIYNPSAKYSVFEEAINKIHGQVKPVVKFMRRWYGYCATGSTREQCFAILYGDGSNGKSTEIDTISEVLGPYANTAAPHLMIASKSTRHPTEIADLFGRRMVTSHESGESGLLSEDFIKQATGGDRLKARHMREDFFEFTPTHKLQLLTNYKPGIRGRDWGIWRRVQLIPYTVTFGDAEKVKAGKADFLVNKDLPQKLSDEREGILNWVIQGAKEWYQNGLNPPDSVRAATDVYKNEEDRVQQFINECCIIDPKADVRLSSPVNRDKYNMTHGLFTTYQKWSKDNGYAALGRSRFQQEVQKKVPQGQWGRDSKNVTVFQGLKLNDHGWS